MEPRQILLLSIALLVPTMLLLTRQRSALLGWVCVTLFVQIFDTVALTNLAAGRIVGFLYLPLAFSSMGRSCRLLAVKAWLWNYLYLVILGIAWGVLWQWPDITQQRSITLLGPGRTCIYLARLLSDFSLAIFVAHQICKPGGLQVVRMALIAGSTLTALGGLTAVLTNMDLYHVITGLSRDFSDIGRERGLSYEPRGLGMACVYGSLLLVLHSKVTLGWLVLLAVNLLGLAIAGSTSALAMFLAGLAAIGFFTGNRQRLLLVAVTGLSLALVASLAMLFPHQFDTVLAEVLYRLDPTERLLGARAMNFGERIGFQLEVFDASAFLFWLDNPLYFLTGAGPGLVSLPASYYVPPGVYSIVWNDDVGVNSLPTHGVLLEISNSGLAGLGLWLLQAGACWKALQILSRQRSARSSLDWTLGRGMFLLGAALYCVQVSISPVWSIFSGIGLGAALLVDTQRRSPSQLAAIPPASRAPLFTTSRSRI